MYKNITAISTNDVPLSPSKQSDNILIPEETLDSQSHITTNATMSALCQLILQSLEFGIRSTVFSNDNFNSLLTSTHLTDLQAKRKLLD